jgi:hypothetical protein
MEIQYNPWGRVWVKFDLTRSLVKTMDMLFNPIYEHEQEYVTLSQSYNGPLYSELADKHLFVFDFSLSRDSNVNNRRAYNIFNLLGDIGGVQIMVMSLG